MHRDIKPENILLFGNEPMVADFGIALAMDAADQERLTLTGLSLGTPAYMSPEQALGDTRVDRRSDIYSLGCVVYEMLAGEPPYTGPTPQAVAKRLTGPPPPLGAVRDVPEALEQAIHTALARNPADRFATGRDFAQALVQAAAAPRATAPARGHSCPPRRSRRWPALAALLAVAVAAARVDGLRRFRGTAPLSASQLAVLPFAVPAAGPSAISPKAWWIS